MLPHIAMMKALHRHKPKAAPTPRRKRARAYKGHSLTHLRVSPTKIHPIFPLTDSNRIQTLANANITLLENSSAGNPPKTFVGQTVDISHQSDTVVKGVDGFTSTARDASKIHWREGSAKDLARITDIKIVAHGGEVLVDAALNTTFTIPHDLSRAAWNLMFFDLPCWRRTARVRPNVGVARSHCTRFALVDIAAAERAFPEMLGLAQWVPGDLLTDDGDRAPRSAKLAIFI